VPDLTKEAVDHLWPVIQIIGAILVVIVAGLVGLWRGFRWLKEQIAETAQAMLAPIAKDVAHAGASTKKAHIRISRLRSDLNLPPDHYDDYEVESEHP